MVSDQDIEDQVNIKAVEVVLVNLLVAEVNLAVAEINPAVEAEVILVEEMIEEKVTLQIIHQKQK